MANATLVAFSEADSGASQVASQTSPTHTWQTGDVLVVGHLNEGGAATLNTPTNTGSGLGPWTLAAKHENDASNGCAGIWTTTATANGSGTITVSQSSSLRLAIGVWQLRAPSGYSISVGNSKLGFGLTGGGTVTVSLTLTSADSTICWLGVDWGATAIASASPASTVHSASSPGPTALPFGFNQGTAMTFYYDVLDDETSTGSASIGYSGVTAGQSNLTIIALEVILAVFVPVRTSDLYAHSRMRAKAQ